MKFGQTFNTYIDKTLEANGIPMLLGEPGIGKSSYVAGYAENKHTKCFTLSCNQLGDKTDLTGVRTLPVGNNDFVQKFFPHYTIREAIDYANDHPRENPILFLDELNRTTSDVTSALLSVATDRTIGSFKLPKNLRIVVAGNDKGNVTALDEASISRFVPIHVEPDAQTFLNLSPDINPFVVSVLTKNPDCIFGRRVPDVVVATSNQHDDDDDDNPYALSDEGIFDDEEKFEQIATPRTIMCVSRWLNMLDKSEILTLISETTQDENGNSVSSLQEIIEGFVGHTVFGNLLLAEITTNISTVNNTTATSITVAKPAVYDELKNQTDRTSLNTYIQGLSDNDKSGCLVYALYEKADNAIYISALSDQIQKLEPNDMKVLMGLLAKDEIDEQNLQCLMTSNSALSSALSVLIG